ncbi:MAG: hypothetical protein QNK11_07705 [Legionella sp.]|nr:hypothetical protein [Legionella sp.]
MPIHIGFNDLNYMNSQDEGDTVSRKIKNQITFSQLHSKIQASAPEQSYIFKLFKQAAQQNLKIKNFIKENKIDALAEKSFLSNLWHAGTINHQLNEFYPLMNEKFNMVITLDLNQIKITDQTSKNTATLLAQYIESLEILLPEKKRAELTQKKDVLNQIINAYKPETRVQQATSFFRNNKANKPSETKIKQIKEKFQTQLDLFIAKTTSLEDRQKKSHEPDRYTNAIKDANNFIAALNTDKKVFETNHNINAFQEAIQKTCSQYENQESFATNRSERWFRTGVAEPFETVKTNLRSLFQVANQSYSPSFFKPEKTDTTKSFETLRDNLKVLDDKSEKKASKKLK